MNQKIWIAAAVLCTTLVAQDSQPEKITVAFRDPSKSGKLDVSLLTGSVTVKAYEGKDVIIESTPRSGKQPARTSRVPPGMHRVGGSNFGVTAMEDNNVVQVRSAFGGSSNLVIQVPAQTALNLKTLSGKIAVENVTGEIDADSLSGGVTLTAVAGPVLAHSMNGKIVALLTKVTPDKSSSFSTMNGGIDVTLPSDAKAKFKMKTNNGEAYTDFDLKLEPSTSTPIVTDNRRNGGRYRVQMDRTMYGTINGGGPELQFQTFNGNIVIHKK